MNSTSPPSMPIALQYVTAMQAAANLPLNNISSEEDRIDAVAFTFGRAAGAHFFLAFHCASPPEPNSAASAFRPGSLFESISSVGAPPYRASAFRSVFLGTGKRYSEEAVCQSMAAGSGMKEHSAKKATEPFLHLLHDMHRYSALKTETDILQAQKRVHSFCALGLFPQALHFCQAILNSKSYTKGMKVFQGRARKEFYFNFLKDAISIAQEAQQSHHAAIWLQMRMQKDAWQQLPDADKEKDWALCGLLLEALCTHPLPGEANGSASWAAPGMSSSCVAKETAKSLWNCVVASGLFESPSSADQQKRCVQGKQAWQTFLHKEVGSEWWRSWRDLGALESQHSDTFCGLPTVSTTDWDLSDFAPLHPLLTSFFHSIVRHAQASPNETSFLPHCVLTGPPGVAKTSFAHALAVAVQHATKESLSKRQVIAVQFPTGFGLRSEYAKSARFAKEKLEELDERAKKENQTVLVLADEMELLFVDDQGTGSASVENARAAQIWYSWLDGSKKGSHLFFLFTTNDDHRMSAPMKSRLEHSTVRWNQTPPLVLRNLLRKSRLNAPLRQLVMNPSELANKEALASTAFHCKEMYPDDAHASDALLPCRPLMSLRQAKVFLDVHREQRRAQLGSTGPSFLQRLMDFNTTEGEKDSAVSGSDPTTDSFFFDFFPSSNRSSSGPGANITSSSERLLEKRNVGDVSYVVSANQTDVILRAIVTPSQQQNIIGFRLDFRRSFPRLMPFASTSLSDFSVFAHKTSKQHGLQWTLQRVVSTAGAQADPFCTIRVTAVGSQNLQDKVRTPKSNLEAKDVYSARASTIRMNHLRIHPHWLPTWLYQASSQHVAEAEKHRA